MEGGPGTSDMRDIFFAMGPYKLNDLNVTLNPNSWTQEFSLLFVDNPVRTGFSFTDNDLGLSTNENQVADNLYEFLQQFFQVFNEYRKNEFYIAGISYAGKYIPSIGYKLMLESEKSGIINGINFKGVAIGNGLIDPIHAGYPCPILKSLGIIDKKQEEEINALEEEVRQLIKKGEYLNASRTGMRISKLIIPSSRILGIAIQILMRASP